MLDGVLPEFCNLDGCWGTCSGCQYWYSWEGGLCPALPHYMVKGKDKGTRSTSYMVKQTCTCIVKIHFYTNLFFFLHRWIRKLCLFLPDGNGITQSSLSCKSSDDWWPPRITQNSRNHPKEAHSKYFEEPSGWCKDITIYLIINYFLHIPLILFCVM